MESLVIIPIKSIDSDWNLAAIDYDFCPFEYCEEMLDIPSESIYDASLSNAGLEINLIDFEEVMNEDWYIQLERIAKYTMVA
ncbi:MAG: hypothetical protein K0U38_11750 [Epsilonproteobacteria bacterium]|nr:hypothetical protein [Campylobacterota bacterium]